MTTRTKKRAAPVAQRYAMPGDLTISTAADTKSAILAVLEQGGDLELDLASTEELDTAGLQVLLMAQREATARGHRLTLVDVPAGVRAVLAVVGFDEALDRVHLSAGPADVSDDTVGEMS